MTVSATLQTSQALIKETLAGRKNTSPQNIYETGQLYSVGALKVACIGLQCIGFNNPLYRGLLEHASQCMQTGKWRAQTGPSPSAFGAGLGTGAQGSPWGSGNINVNINSTNATPTRSGPGSPVITAMGPGAPVGATLRGRAGLLLGPGPGPTSGPTLGLGLGLGPGPGQPPSGIRTGVQHGGSHDISAASGLRSTGKL